MADNLGTLEVVARLSADQRSVYLELAAVQGKPPGRSQIGGSLPPAVAVEIAQRLVELAREAAGHAELVTSGDGDGHATA